MNKETIRLEELSIGYSIKKHHAKEVASHIQATIRSGELTCLLGENGVGKSTLLRTLSAFHISGCSDGKWNLLPTAS